MMRAKRIPGLLRIAHWSIGTILECSLLAGCAAPPPGPPKYVTNWEQLRVGMSKVQVVKLLGDSPEKVGPGEMGSPATMPSLAELPSQILGAIVISAVLQPQYERWHYGQFEAFANLITPDPKAYVVYFDRSGKVVMWRRPLPPGPSTRPT